MNTSGVDSADMGVGGTEGPVARVLTVPAVLLLRDPGDGGGEIRLASGSDVRDADGRWSFAILSRD